MRPSCLLITARLWAPKNRFSRTDNYTLLSGASNRIRPELGAYIGLLRHPHTYVYTYYTFGSVVYNRRITLHWLFSFLPTNSNSWGLDVASPTVSNIIELLCLCFCLFLTDWPAIVLMGLFSSLLSFSPYTLTTHLGLNYKVGSRFHIYWWWLKPDPVLFLKPLSIALSVLAEYFPLQLWPPGLHSLPAPLVLWNSDGFWLVARPRDPIYGHDARNHVSCPLDAAAWSNRPPVINKIC